MQSVSSWSGSMSWATILMPPACIAQGPVGQGLGGSLVPRDHGTCL